jgi:hypothetical protein
MSARPHFWSSASKFSVALDKFAVVLSRILFNFHSYRVLPYLLITTFFTVAIASRILFNGMVYQFDYGLYQPDGIHYTIRTLMMIGNSDLSAAQTVADWYAAHGTKVKELDPRDFIPQNNPAWPVIAPRVLYPILSIPFVMYLGVPGMLVVPALSLLATMFAIYFYSRGKGAPWVGLLIAISISISPTVLRWSVSNCTDGLLMAIFAGAALVALDKKESRWALPKIVVIVAMACLTRFCLPIWILLALVIYRPNKKMSYAIISSSLLFSAPTFMYKSDSGKIPASDNFSTMHDYIMFPITFLKILFVELAQLAALDRTLLVIILLATALSVAKFREFESKLYFAVFLGVFTLGAINAVLGVNFRYQLPLIPFAAVAIISQVVAIKNRKFLNE